MMFQKCILHIGMEKTGTTTLQALLSANRDTLKTEGCYVPSCLSPYRKIACHELLTTYSLSDHKTTDNLRMKLKVLNHEDVYRHRENVIQALNEEFESHLSPQVNTLILSNEHCSSRLVDLSEVKKLHDLIYRYVQNVEVYIYIRPQHETAISLYNTALQMGYSDIAMPPIFEEKQNRWVTKSYFDIASVLRRWSDVFGANSIHVRIFDSNSLVENDICSDFIEAANLPKLGLRRPVLHNKSLGVHQQIALNAFNRYLRRQGRSVSSSIRQRLIALLRQAAVGPSMTMDRASAERFFHQFDSVNEEVKQRFFPNRATLFDVDFSKFPLKCQPTITENEAILEFMTTLLEQNAEQRPVMD